MSAKFNIQIAKVYCRIVDDGELKVSGAGGYIFLWLRAKASINEVFGKIP